MEITKKGRPGLSARDWIWAATRLLAEHGVAAVRVEPLAKRMGVTKGSFYWHFADRRALLNAVRADWESRATLQVIERVEADGGDAGARLRRLFELVAREGSGAVERAMRAWAASDTAAAAVLRRVDGRRLRYLESLFRALGFGRDEARMRARLVYFAVIGEYTVGVEASPEQRLAAAMLTHRLVTGQVWQHRIPVTCWRRWQEGGGMDTGVHLAESDGQKQAIYRFRYEIYVEEMGRYRAIADHTNRWLIEPEDAHSRLYMAVEDGALVGTMRHSWGGDAPFPARQVNQYALAPFLDEMPDEQLIVGERFMIAPAYRGSDVLFKLFSTYLGFVNDKRIQLVFGDCEPHLLNVYLGLGFRTYSDININSTETGYLIPLVMVPEDLAYMQRIRSPLAEILTDFGEDAGVPACADRLIDRPTAVLSQRLVDPEVYLARIYESLSALEAARVSLFDGLDEAQVEACLAKSNVIDCRTGDRVLKKSNTAQNLFVLLSGVLEVKDEDVLIGVITPGEVFGEIAFLLKRPRTKDVFAATDDTRILSLSETTIRKLTESDPLAAAKLMTNISKMLCWRLVRDG